MKKLALLGLALMACAAQEPPKPYTVTVEKLLVKATDNDATLEVELSTNLPDRAVLTLQAQMATYDYAYDHDYFTYVPPDFNVGSPLSVPGTVANGRIKSLKLNLPANGLWRIEIRFDPGRQQDRTLRRKMGLERFGLMSLHERTLAVGATRRVFEEILKDSAACRTLLHRCQETLDRLNKVGDADDEEEAMAKKAIPLVQKLSEDAGEFYSRIDKTLLNATYRYGGNVLAGVGLAGQFLKDLVKKKQAEEKEKKAGSGTGDVVPGSGSGSGDPDAPFAPNPSGGVVDPATGETLQDQSGHDSVKEKGYKPIPDPSGGKLSFSTLAERIIKADEVRLREVFLWVIRFTRIAHENLFSAADSVRRGGSKDAARDVFNDEETALKEIDKTVATLLQTEKTFDKFQTLGNGQKFSELPGKIGAYLKLVRQEIDAGMAPDEPKDQETLRKEIVDILDTFDRRILGKKAAPKNP